MTRGELSGHPAAFPRRAPIVLNPDRILNCHAPSWDRTKILLTHSPTRAAPPGLPAHVRHARRRFTLGWLAFHRLRETFIESTDRQTSPINATALQSAQPGDRYHRRTRTDRCDGDPRAGFDHAAATVRRRVVDIPVPRPLNSTAHSPSEGSRYETRPPSPWGFPLRRGRPWPGSPG